MESFPSRLLEKSVAEFAKLPGIGRKTALRLVLHLLRKSQDEVEEFGNSMIQLKREIKYCKRCHNISDFDVCSICENKSRGSEIICVVENIRDILTIENTGQYRGLYHVLGGIISPMDGIGPSELNINSLIERIEKEDVTEIILALSTTVEGDTTNYYIYKRLKTSDVLVTTLARGLAVGGELEYADEVTLGRSLLQRTPFEQSLRRKG
ncbi:MAG: recombination mediator RecR [Bacteroidales bacterium]